MFRKFKKLKNLVETQSGYKLKYLKIDKEGEYMSNEFENYYKDNGIKNINVPCLIHLKIMEFLNDKIGLFLI